MEWCCRVGAARDPWPLENTQETKQGQYITTCFQVMHIHSYFEYIVRRILNTTNVSTTDFSFLQTCVKGKDAQIKIMWGGKESHQTPSW